MPDDLELVVKLSHCTAPKDNAENPAVTSRRSAFHPECVNIIGQAEMERVMTSSNHVPVKSTLRT